MPRADLEHGEIERPEPLADLPILGREACVTAEEHPVPRRAHDQRGPQRRVARLERAPGEVLRRRGGNREIGIRQRIALPPVELDDALWRYAPGFEMRSDAERGHERDRVLPQLSD